MRKHVMMTLLDTEQSYVESLRTLIQVNTHTHTPAGVTHSVVELTLPVL